MEVVVPPPAALCTERSPHAIHFACHDWILPELPARGHSHVKRAVLGLPTSVGHDPHVHVWILMACSAIRRPSMLAMLTHGECVRAVVQCHRCAHVCVHALYSPPVQRENGVILVRARACISSVVCVRAHNPSPNS
jgi:hypothetical protein